MSGEKRRGQWHSEAERIFDEVSGLTSLAQSEAFREQLDCIGDNNARSAIELLVWSWLRDGKTSFGVGSIELFSTNMILTATFALVFLIGWLELDAPLVWSAAIALVTTIAVRFVFRLFDRGFMFRRLFTACVGSGLFLIAPAQLQFAFDTPLDPISWGGAPGGALVMIWAICTLLTFGVAVWEHYVSGRT